MEQKSSTADRVSKRLPDAYSCQPEGLRQTQKKKKRGGGNHEYLDLSEERSQWRRSSLDLPSIAIERANRLFPLCAMSTCDLHLLHFSSQRIFETKEDLFEILLFKGFLVLNGYRYSREFTHLLFVWSKEDLFERILLDFSFFFIGIIFRMQYCNIPCVCRKSFQNSLDDYSKETIR